MRDRRRHDAGRAGHRGAVPQRPVRGQAGQAGRRPQVYEPKEASLARRRFSIETELRRALDKEELKLFYQPLIDLKSGEVAGFEALARWTHEDRGEISPTEFIPVAEESGLILQLGRWAMDKATSTLADWDKAAGENLPLYVGVNLSAIQVSRDNVAEVVESALRSSGLTGDRLTLELTESSIVQDPARATRVFDALKALDTTVAMDDFGTGYSSLAYLQRLPIDVLKIDRSFVSGMMVDPDSVAIVRAVLSLADALGMSTTAEGIETVELATTLAALGCASGQGYYFAKPLEPEAALDYWTSRRRKAADQALAGRQSGYRSGMRDTASIEQLVAASPIAAVVTNPRAPDNPIEAVNTAFCQLTGYSTPEIIGRNCRFLAGAETEPWVTAELRQAIAERRPAMVEILNYRRDGTSFLNGVMITPLFDPDGEVAWFLGSQVDLGSATRLAGRPAAAAEHLVAGLSPRQRQVLELLAKGLLNKQIAGKLELSEKTVKMHRALLFRRLGAARPPKPSASPSKPGFKSYRPKPIWRARRRKAQCGDKRRPPSFPPSTRRPAQPEKVHARTEYHYPRAADRRRPQLGPCRPVRASTWLRPCSATVPAVADRLRPGRPVGDLPAGAAISGRDQ